ncbi:MAG: cupin domain-containing protein [Bacillota bacterium]
MIRAGFVIENPLTRSRTTVVESDVETKGMGWLLEVICLPNAGPDIAEHVHLTWTETFEISKGIAHYKIGGVQKTIQAGESFTVLPGQLHVHPWNAGDSELVFRQRNEFGHSAPGAVQDVLGVFATIAGLARQGKVDKRGLPKNPLQLAVTIRTLSKHGGYDAAVPLGVQKLMAATLGRLAEWLGYRGVDPQYVHAE